MKKLKNFFNKLIFKYIYISIFIFLIPVFFIDRKLDSFRVFLSNSGNISSLAEISGTFIGFLLTVATIYFSIPSESKFKKWFVKYGHNKIFIKIILFGIICFMVPIASWIFNCNIMSYVALYSFIAGCLEVLVAVYYLYHLIIKNPL
jgi:hypothetical protein